MELICKGLTKHYGAFVGLGDFNQTFTPGVYGILGPNGSGKSTLMNLLTDNISRTKGEILLDGKEILTLGAAYRRRVGYMPQQQGFFPELSALAFLRYMAELKGIPHRESREECLRCLAAVGLAEAQNKAIGAFSVGMRQRVLLAQALLGEPDILLLDEPTAGLDPRERVRVRNLISGLREQRVVLVATHIVSDVELIADQILILRKGTLLTAEPQQALEARLTDKVRLYPAEEQEALTAGTHLRVGSELRRGGRTLVRLIGDALPEGGLPPEEITLDDVYLYYAGDC